MKTLALEYTKVIKEIGTFIIGISILAISVGCYSIHIFSTPAETKVGLGLVLILPSIPLAVLGFVFKKKPEVKIAYIAGLCAAAYPVGYIAYALAALGGLKIDLILVVIVFIPLAILLRTSHMVKLGKALVEPNAPILPGYSNENSTKPPSFTLK